ncbi:hypothetical protein FGO68_gene2332 [Halteria grandinella]|uniref:TLDc domain-containing protein n=1 Tax=Halteria grandinella TaxID=5974 RepID=A0A8J8NVQ4_HALGN|nr:hypothetical protein FGO68_gene2332 [Halteria grandinella]
MAPDKHGHCPVFIAKMIRNITDEWSKLNHYSNKLRSQSQKFLQIHGPLVEFLDRYQVAPEKSLSIKITQLEELSDQLERFFHDSVAELSTNGDIFTLEQLNPSLIYFKERLENLEFFKNIGPELLWNVYSDIFHLVRNKNVLESLSYPNVETFIKLKLYTVQLDLNEILNSYQLEECNLQEYFENPELNTCQIIEVINEKIQTLLQNIEQFDNAEIDSIRSELDNIGVIQIYLALKDEMVHNQQTSAAQLADLNNKYEELVEWKTQYEQLPIEEESKLIQNSMTSERQRIINSAIIDDNKKLSKIMAFLAQSGRSVKYFRLQYRGSADSFAARSFHKKCDRLKNSLTIVRTTEGNIIGGFSTQNWKGKGWKQDENAWLFNIEAPSIFKIKQGNMKAIYADPTYGPIFGQGHDLLISDRSNITNCTAAGKSYQNGGGVSNLLLLESSSQVPFKVEEIEVFSI